MNITELRLKHGILAIICFFSFALQATNTAHFCIDANLSESELAMLDDCDVAPALDCPNAYYGCPGDDIRPSVIGQAESNDSKPNCSHTLTFSDTVIENTPCLYKVERVWRAQNDEPVNNWSEYYMYDQCNQIIILKDNYAPTIGACPSDITVNLNLNCQGIATWTEPIISDDCGVASIVQSHQSGADFPLGITNVTYTVTDNCGKEATCSFKVTVQGSCCQTAPVISCPGNLEVCVVGGDANTHPNATGYATATPADSNCTSQIQVSYSDSVTALGDCVGAKKIVRTWSAYHVDDPSLVSTCTQTINERDLVVPVISNCPSNIVLNADNGNFATVSWAEPTATDNCTLISLSADFTNGGTFPQGNTTVTYTATDGCGNTATCSFNITVNVPTCNAAPIISCPQNAMRCPTDNMAMNAYSPNSTGYATAVAASQYCGTPIVTYSDDVVDMPGCEGGAKIYRIWTATDPDNASLSSTCTQIINLNDPVSPTVNVCTNDVIVDTENANGTTVTFDIPSFTDNCAVRNISGSHASGDQFPVGTTTVTFSAEDFCGNIIECEFAVKVGLIVCGELPIINCPSNAMRCPGEVTDNTYLPSSTGFATASPGGSNCDQPEVTYSDQVIDMPGCSGGKKIYRTWTATDPNDSSLTSSCVQIINGNDPVDPILTFCPDDISVQGSAGGAVVTFVTPMFSDNCKVQSIVCNQNSGSTFAVGQTTVTCTAYDMCGNFASCDFKVTVSQPQCTTPPTISCPADITLCVGSNNGPSISGSATGTPAGVNCGTTEVSYTDVVLSTGPCSGAKVIERKWVVTDQSNSSLTATCSQKITIADTQNPVITSCPSDVLIQGGPWCDGIGQWADVTATDNCGIASITSTHDSGELFNAGTTQVTYTVTDNCGNTSTCSFNVIVACTNFGCSAPPVIYCPADITLCVDSSIERPSTGSATATAGLSSCDDPEVSFTDVVMSEGPCQGAIVIKRIWTATDPNDSSNFATCHQLITLEDNQPPTLFYCPDDITANGGAWCDAVVTWDAITATDNCGLPNITSSHSSGSVFNEGVTNVTYTAIDDCGNTKSCSFKVTVTCNNPCQAPSITCPANVSLCPGSPYSPAATGQAQATSGAGCTSSPKVDHEDVVMSTGPCQGARVVKRIWTATDLTDPTLKATCEQIIKLEDIVAPGLWDCPDNITGTYGTPVHWTAPIADDNCTANPTLTSTHNSGSTFPPGNTTVVYTAKDDCGNQATCSFTVTVPGSNNNLTCPDDISVQCNSNGGAHVNWNTPSTSGSCGDCSGEYIPGFVYMGTYNGHLYYCSLDPATWPTASSVCNANGGYLASIGSAGENNFLANILTIQSAWMGLNDAAQEGNFVWSNGDPLTFANWYPQQPNDYNFDQDYCEILADGTWNDQYGNKPLEFIMEVPCGGGVQQVAGPAPGSYLPTGHYEVIYQLDDSCGGGTCSFTIDVESSISIDCHDDAVLSCPVNESGLYVKWETPIANSCCADCSAGGNIPGYLYMGSYNGHFYYCSDDPASWPQANAACQQYGGYLAAIGSAGENQFLANILTIQSAWIGLNDAQQEGNYQWSNGESLGYTNWYPGQPNNHNNYQDYCEMTSNGEWNDQFNNEHLEYIMEIPGCIHVTQISGPPSGSWFNANTTTTVTYKATDDCGNSTTCSFDITIDKNDCQSGGKNSSAAWIQKIKYGSINNASGNNGGYEDFTNQCTTVQPGGQYTIGLTPGFAGSKYKVFWKVWIDFNMDGDYNDSGEFVAYGSGTGPISGNITMPYTNIWTGTTTMRVAMKVGDYPTGPCEVFNYGETEDYCVEVIGADLQDDDDEIGLGARSSDPENAIEAINLSQIEIAAYGVNIYPNPASDFINLDIETIEDVDVIEVFTVTGTQIMNIVKSNSKKVDVEELENGIYMMSVKYNDGTIKTSRFIIQK